jgi:hypothetical protein
MERRAAKFRDTSYASRDIGPSYSQSKVLHAFIKPRGTFACAPDAPYPRLAAEYRYNNAAFDKAVLLLIGMNRRQRYKGVLDLFSSGPCG